ncbi:MAG: hypothetical protein D6711_03520 [Chloroflexi bacterium]|nr:MAG: hypothetical protein D6711_03520 [Chloroflexota bacterium]
MVVNMPGKVLLAPSGAGKTAYVLERLNQVLDEKHFARIWVLLATKRQEDAFRERLIASGRHVAFNVEFFNFYELYERLLNKQGKPQRQINELTRLRLIRAIIHELNLPIHTPIAQTQGLARIVGELIYELKQNRIEPHEFAQRTQSAREREIAKIYEQYQRMLQEYNLVDREGQAWLAVNALQAAPLARDVDLLIVDGFDQFNAVQIELLIQLANQVQQTLITLPTVPQREKTIGRRFSRTRNALATFDVEYLPANHHNQVDIRTLIDAIFKRGLAPKPNTGGVQFIEAPDPSMEVGAVLRRVKQLLLENIPPDDILITLRNWERYYTYFVHFGRKYQLPLALHYGMPLRENPVIVALLNMITLHQTGFLRRDVLDVISSPYFSIPGLDTTLLEWISRQMLLIGGREAWLHAIKQIAFRTTNYDDDDNIPKSSSLDVDPEHLDRLHQHLAVFFDAITPPETGTIRDMVLWLERLIGQDPDNDPDIDNSDYVEQSQIEYTLNTITQVKVSEHQVPQDLAALHELKRLLRDLIAADELVMTFGAEDKMITREQFIDDLLAAINVTNIEAHPSHAGRVLVTTTANARGLPHKHIFILGLSEGLFPATTSEDPLFLDSEREYLQLTARADQNADDSVFYELICQAYETLTLSRPTHQDGKPWMPSNLWRASLAVFDSPQVNRLKLGQPIPLMETATHDELAILAASGDEDALAWLQHNGYWYWLEHGIDVELQRLSRMPYNHYSGRLQSDSLKNWVKQTLGASYRWSASQLNDLGICGFRFFAKRLLKLETLEEPETGIDAAQLGTLNHNILQKTYQKIRELELQINPENQEQALQILRDVAYAELEQAPQQLGFHETALWKHERQVLLRKLEQLVKHDFSSDSLIHKHFGGDERIPHKLEEYFLFDLPLDDETITVHGYIDRIDQLGDAAIVIDYKTGGTKINVSELEIGRNFQMMVYLLAAREEVKPPITDVRGGMFWHISNQQVSGVMMLDEKGLSQIEQGKAHLNRYIAAARQGDFAVHATKLEEGKCVRYCEFYNLCRKNNTNPNKS